MIWSRETARLAARVDALAERIEALATVERVNGAQFNLHSDRIGALEDSLAALQRVLDARTEHLV